MAVTPALYSLVLPTRLHPPRLRANRIARARLLTKLDIAQTKLTLLVAPAGFGKTTLLNQWVRRRSEPVAWLTLSPDDNALTIFLFALLSAIQHLDRDVVDVTMQQRMGPHAGEIEAVFAHLLNDPATFKTPWTLVLDDYHVIDNAQVDHVVRQLLEHTPNTFRIVIASRTAPRLPVARLRVHEELTYLNADELRVSAAELPSLIAEYGIAASAAEQRALIEHTNGWIVALHLAAITANAQPLGEVIRSLAGFNGDFDLLGDFLLQEVLDQQPPEVRRFLLQTAILERFTEAACRAVTGSAGAAQLLEQVQRRKLFLAPLDELGEWFHYHHLFRDFLLRRLLLEVEPEDVVALHAAAGAWFEQQGLVGEAINHTIKAEEWARAAALISRLATSRFLQHGESDLLVWLLSFPTTVLHADANLSSLTAYTLIRLGRGTEAEPLLAAAEQQWRAAGNAYGLALIGVVRGALARFRDDDAALITHAVDAIAHATGEAALDAEGRLATLTPRLIRLEGTWLGSVGQQLSYAHLTMGLRLQGRLAEAAGLYDQIEGAFNADGQALTDTYYAPEAANIYLAQGLLLQVESTCSAFLQHDGLASERMLGMALLGEVLREWNRLPAGEQVVREALALAARFEAPVFLPLLYNTLARIRWSSGDDEAALASLDAADEAAAALGNIRRAREATALRVRIALAGGDLAPALRWAAYRGFEGANVPTRTTLPELLVYARLLMAQDEPAGAAALLSDLGTAAAGDRRQHDLVHIEVLQSMAYFDLGDRDLALAELQKVLALAAPEGYVRAFLDEGTPMRRLLRIARRRFVQLPYVQRLLDEEGEDLRKAARIVHPALIESITAREHRVLQLLHVGLTNRELGEELGIALPTVKRHVANLYGKLGASSRSEALQKAYGLGLLSKQPAATPSAAGSLSE